jgi:hypothetical protein
MNPDTRTQGTTNKINFQKYINFTTPHGTNNL